MSKMRFIFSRGRCELASYDSTGTAAEMVFPKFTCGEVIVGVSVFPDYERVNAHLASRGITEESECYEEELEAIFKSLVRDVNKKLPSFKHIRKMNIRKTDFEKTTTKKIKRFAAENRAE